MNSKLTLRLDKNLIESAKKYSARTGKSLSRIVTDLFSVIAIKLGEKESSITPGISSLKGILKNRELSENDYKEHLEDKYL